MTNNIKFSDNLILGDGIKKPEKLLSRLSKGKTFTTFFVVCFCNDSKRLEILNSHVFLQSYFQNESIEVFGVFKSKDEAFEYIRIITGYSYAEYNVLDLYRLLHEKTKNDVENYRLGETIDGGDS